MADAKWSAKDAKATPAAADQVLIIDSADGLNRRITLDDIPLTGNIELKALATGLLKNTTTTGTPSIAVAADLPSGIDAVKIADGSVTNTEFQYIGTLASNAQTQITGISTAVSSAATINPGHHHVVSAIATGTADAMVGTFTPAVAALTDGMRVDVYAVGANTVVDPTFQYNALTAKTIVKGAATALAVGDIPEANYKCEFSYRAATDKWILLNPAITVKSVGTAAGTVAAGNDGRFPLTPTTATQAVGTGDSPTFVAPLVSALYATGTTALRSGGATSQYLYGKIMYAQTAAFTLSGATTVSPALTIPAGAIVLGVGCKVTTAVTGATSFQLGDGVTADKWATGCPIALNSMIGTTYTPAGAFGLAAYPSGGTVTVTAVGSDFTGGQLRVIVWYFWIGV